MNGRRKGFLIASSVLTIVNSVLILLTGIVLILMGTITTEESMKNDYLNKPEVYTYGENLDGSYYFTYVDDDGFTVKMNESEIELTAKVMSITLKVIGVSFLVVNVIRLILAIRILVNVGKNKFGKPSVITSMIINICLFNYLDVVLTIVGMVSADHSNHTATAVN